MTDTNHIEVLQGFAITYDAQSTIGQAFRAAITALSARASAGEGGVVVPRTLLEKLLKRDEFDGACRCINHSRNAEREYESGECPHQRLAELLTAAPQPAQAGASGGELRAWVGDMKTSAGMDYYVCVGRDTGNPFDRTYLTPHKYSIRGRAEYDVAEWNHLLGHGPKPDILAFDTQPTPASPATDRCTCPSETRCAGTCPYYLRLHAAPPAHGDGEGDAFEAWASSQKYDMTTHPLHWLFLNERTYAARQGWKAGMEYALTTRPTPEAQEARDACVWAFDDDDRAPMWNSACGEAWSFTEGGPEDNNYRYCHGCGKPIDALALPAQGEGK